MHNDFLTFIFGMLFGSIVTLAIAATIVDSKYRQPAIENCIAQYSPDKGNFEFLNHCPVKENK